MSAAQPTPPGSSFWHLPVDAARHGPAFDAHLLLNLWVALALLVLAHLILLAGMVVRRHSPRSGRTMLLEYLPLAALTLIFAWLGVRAQQLWAAQRFVGPDPEAMQVEVTGVQFVWYFRYPGLDATFGTTRLALASPGEGNPLGPEILMAPTTSSAANWSCPRAVRWTSRCTRRTSSTDSPCRRCGSSRMLFPERPRTSTSRRRHPASTPSSAPSCAVWDTTACRPGCVCFRRRSSRLGCRPARRNGPAPPQCPRPTRPGSTRRLQL